MGHPGGPAKDGPALGSGGVLLHAGCMKLRLSWSGRSDGGCRVSHKRALDFGCGVGRLTQPLADHFEEVRGVDVSPVMLEQARQFNRHGDRCQYVWNDAADLRMFADRSHRFHLFQDHAATHPAAAGPVIFEGIHAGAGARRIVAVPIAEPVRLSLPGNHRQDALPVARVQSLMRVPPAMYMNGIGRERVIALLERHGGRVVEIEPNTDAGPEYESFLYAVTLA